MKLIDYSDDQLVYFDKSNKPLVGILLSSGIGSLAAWTGASHVLDGRLATGAGILALIGGPLFYIAYSLGRLDRALTVTFDRPTQTVTLAHQQWLRRNRRTTYHFDDIAAVHVHEQQFEDTTHYGVHLELTSGAEVPVVREYRPDARTTCQNMVAQIRTFIAQARPT